MASETSVDFNFNILDGDGKVPTPKNNNDQTQKAENNPIKKPESSDTDFYLNLIANQNKLKEDSDLNSNATSSLSEIVESDSSESEVEENSESSRKSDSSRSNSSRSRNSSKASSSKSSRAKYEKVNLSPSNKKSNNAFIPAQHHDEQKKQLTPQEMRMKKIELLRRLSELKTKGYELSKSYDFSSSIEEMEYEYDLLKSFANKRNGIKLYKNILLNTVSAVEFLNDKYDPFEFELNGWSEHMSVEVDSYDDVLEELYEKYKGTGKKMPPEVKLLMLIIASASAFHFSKSTFKNLPGVEKVLQNNPDLIAKMMNPKKESSQFMSEQEINLERQKQAILEKEKAKRNANKQNQQPMNSFVNNNFSPYQGNQQPQPQQTANIKAPLNVQDILNRLHNSENNSAASETQDETSSNNDRIVGTSSLNSSEKRKGRKKKTIMTIS